MKHTIRVPETLADITLEQYIAVSKLTDENEQARTIKVLEILCGLSEEQIRATELSDLSRIITIVTGVLESETEVEVKHTYEYKGVTYGLVPDLSRVTLAEFADIDTLCQDGVLDNLPQVMGILYRPVTEQHGKFYLVADYDGADRTEQMLEMPADIAVGALNFFLTTGVKLVDAFRSYTKGEVKMKSPASGDGMRPLLPFATGTSRGWKWWRR